MLVRYAILRHEGIDPPHFDLLFEAAPGSMLAAWRSDTWPIVAPTPLVRLADHRPRYLDYEGAISGNRGHVRRVESGTCTIENSQQQWTILLLAGQRLSLRRIHDDQWLGTIS
jgi:hypothetical protein